MSDLSTSIDAAAQAPQTVTADGLTVGAHPLVSLIAADRYLAAKAAASTKKRGMMYSKLLPAGPVSDQQTTGFGGITEFGNGGWW